ncbi:translation initiation factor IF-5A [Candidatus Pacearchaeota archaeon]|nr:translation initiation factor IF-5A [Candidatus Pacearchaeota archaeon]
MPLKLVNAHELKAGNYVIIDDAPCIVKGVDISKTGKHGSSKARIEAVGLIDDKKRILIKPGSERLPVPLIEKKRGQILSINQNASIMDLESYETLEVKIPEEMKENLKDGMQVEYWNIEGTKIIKRIM